MAAPKKPAEAVEPDAAEAETDVKVDRNALAYDLIGADGRRILRYHALAACEALAARIKDATGEKLSIKPSA